MTEGWVNSRHRQEINKASCLHCLLYVFQCSDICTHTVKTHIQMHGHDRYAWSWQICMVMTDTHGHDRYAWSWQICMVMTDMHGHDRYAYIWSRSLPTCPVKFHSWPWSALSSLISTAIPICLVHVHILCIDKCVPSK